MSNKHIKIGNGDILSEKEVEIFGHGSNNTSGPLLPLGSIIAVHKDLSFNVDIEYWKLCDGASGIVITFPDNTQSSSFTVPSLTDNRFLMGSTSITTYGGYNGNHNHSSSGLILTHPSSDANNTGSWTNWLGNHTHGVKADPPWRDWYVFGADNTYHTTQTFNKGRTTNGTNASGHTHNIVFSDKVFGTGYDSDVTSTSNIPKYYTVDFFIRIK